MVEQTSLQEKAEPAAERPGITAGYGILPATEGSGLMPWSRVVARMTEARNYWIGTTRPDGRPHAIPVWGLWLDDAFYFSTDRLSRKARNLAANPHIVAHLESGDDVVILEGVAEEVRGTALPAAFADAYEAKYQFRPDTQDPALFYVLRARVALAWLEHDYPGSATRWRLQTD